MCSLGVDVSAEEEEPQMARSVKVVTVDASGTGLTLANGA